MSSAGGAIVAVIVGLACVGLIAAVPALIIVSHRRTVRRRSGLLEFAQAREWGYQAADPSLVRRFSGAPFGRGTRRRALNVLVGRHEGRPFTAYDYHFTTSSGDNSTRHTYSVIALHLGVVAPDLAVGRTTTMKRWINALTGRDIKIGDPAFDDAFTVHSTSPEFAVDLLRSDVRDVMRAHPDLSWRIASDSLLMIRSGAHSPDEVDGKLQIMKALLDRVPVHVWERLRGEPPR